MGTLVSVTHLIYHKKIFIFYILYFTNSLLKIRLKSWQQTFLGKKVQWTTQKSSKKYPYSFNENFNLKLLFLKVNKAKSC